MRIGIEHTTGFRYAKPVRSSYNQARMTPVNNAQQTVWSARLTIDPTPWSYTATDYYGNIVTTFELHEPHSTMTVRADSVVDTRGDALDAAEPRAGDLDFAALTETRVTDEFAEYLELRHRTAPHEDLAERARELVDGHTPREAAVALCGLVYDRLRYQAGASKVTTPASEIWADGRGVCQDFSHVTVGALRSMGIPARYVSGYLHPSGGTPNVAVDGESHSWVEWWAGSWTAFDPTARSSITDHYVRVGHGRDYGDVPPLRGTYAGGESTMFVNVALTRLG